MYITKEFLSESTNGEPINITGLASVATTQRAVASNVATITSATHSLTTGDYIYLSGMGDSSYDGIHQVTVTSTTEFTFSLTHADESTTADTAGTVQKITKIHTACSGTTNWDELWINVTNIYASSSIITLFYGEDEPSEYYTVVAKDGIKIVVAGDILQNSNVIYAYADIDNALKVRGYVNQITV